MESATIMRHYVAGHCRRATSKRHCPGAVVFSRWPSTNRIATGRPELDNFDLDLLAGFNLVRPA